MMKTFRTPIFAMVLGFSAVPFANASLIVNGGFEEPGLQTTVGQLNPAIVPGWGASAGTTIELWNRVNGGPTGPAPYEGVQYLELNSKGSGPFSIFQTFNSVIGTFYEVTFAHSARRNTTPAEEFSLYLGDANGNGQTTNIVNGPQGTWSTATFNFMATSETSKLEFLAINPATETIGNFLDDVKVTDVPEPGTLALFGIALTSLIAVRRKKAA